MNNLFFYYVDDDNEELVDKINKCVENGLCKDIGHNVVMFLEDNLTPIKEAVGDNLEEVECFETFINNDDQGDYIRLDFAGNRLELSKENVCHELIDNQEHYQKVFYNASDFWQEYDNIAYSVFLMMLEGALLDFKTHYGNGKPIEWK